MRFLSLLTLAIISLALMAGKFPDLPVKHWDSGEVLLNNGERLKGKIFYEIEKELLLVFSKGQIKTFSPQQIDKFYIKEEPGAERLFYSIPIAFKGSKRRNYFFEIMTQGHVVYLRRQRARADGFGSFFTNENQFAGYTGFFEYYCLWEDKLVKIKKFKKDAMQLMDKHRPKMEIFIKNNGLQLYKLEDQVRLLKYYNSLCEEDEAVANNYGL